MSYFTEIEAWLTDILIFDDEVDASEEEWFVRVKSQIKAKLLESYRNGQKAEAPSAEKPARGEIQEHQKRDASLFAQIQRQ